MKLSKNELKRIIEAYMGRIGSDDLYAQTSDQNVLGQSIQDQTGDVPEDLLKKLGPTSKAKIPIQKKAATRLPKSKWSETWKGEGDPKVDILDVKPTEATRILGDAFPESNVFIIPVGMTGKELGRFLKQPGSENEYDKYQVKATLFKKTKLDKYAPYYDEEHEADIIPDKDFYYITDDLPDFDGNRSQVKMLWSSLDILKKLGVTNEEFEKINPNKDIVFVPLTTTSTKNFTLKPWILLHSLLDTRSFEGEFQSKLDKMIEKGVKPFRSKLIGSEVLDFQGVESDTLADYLQKNITTGAGRAEGLFTLKDAFVEMLVQELSQSHPVGQSNLKNNALYMFNQAGVNINVEAFDKLPLKIQDVMLDAVDYIRKVAKEIRQYLKGKLVFVDIA